MKENNIPVDRKDLFGIFDQMNDPILVLNDTGGILFCNEAMVQLSGYDNEESMPKKVYDLIKEPDHETDHFETQMMNKEGSLIEIDASVSTVNMEGNSYKTVWIRDISSEKAIRRELDRRLQLASDLAENAPIGIITCDASGNIVYLNRKVADLLGSPNAEETIKINLFTFPLLMECGFSDKLKKSLETDSHLNYELNYESKWGRKIWLNVHNKPFLSEGERYAMVILDDLTERKKLEKQLTSLSYTDELTGIFNRRYFLERAEDEIIQAKQLHRSFSIIMLDLDHFKRINDHFGHDVGDVILKTITSCIMEKIRKTDIMARWGGEEFILLLTDITYNQAAVIAEKLRKHLMLTAIPPVGRVTASFGVAAYQDGDTVEDMIQRADKLLYCAKADGRNCVKC